MLYNVVQNYCVKMHNPITASEEATSET